MTAVPETLQSSSPIRASENAYLEQLFLLGYATSEPKTIFKNDAMEIVVVYRTLTPVEMREVFEVVAQFSSSPAQAITTELEILARAIVTINHMPLVLDSKDREDFEKKYNRTPSSLDMARYILHDKIKSVHVLDMMYEEFNKFVDLIAKNFSEAQKKSTVTS
jgi:hypothetical protein